MPRSKKIESAKTEEVAPVTVTRVPRLDQRGLEPSAIKPRLLGNVIQLSNLSTTSISLNNGDQVIFQSHLADSDDKRHLANTISALFVGTAGNAGFELPGGASVDESQWQVIGPYNSFFFNQAPDPTIETDYNETILHQYVRNISAGTQTVYFYTRHKYIINQGGTGANG